MDARALTFDVERRFPRGPTVRARASVPLGERGVTVLFGPSGSGKTTVLRMLAGLDRPDAGTIRRGEELWADAAAGTFVPPQRREVGYLFQDYALFPHLTVAANVAYGLGRVPRAARTTRVRDLAARLGFEDLLSRRPGELSGGQKQRVALARALAPSPGLLLLDEPLSALDAPTRDRLRGELRAILEASRVPAIVVTHDRAEALALGDRMIVLVGGAVRQVGPVHEVFSLPADVDVARTVGTENVLPARIVARDGGLATARSGGLVLTALDPGGTEEEAYACIRAEEVLLEDAPEFPSSALNRLPSVVVSRAEEGPLVRVVLAPAASGAGGEPRLVALVTRRSAEALALRPGREIVARVKAPAIRLVPRAAAPAP
jgi:molybdate transport system ATP-binding protein